MKAGFYKQDITPPVGCELAGFGHYLNRHSTSVRDRLFASALVAEEDGVLTALISCDLLLVTAEQTEAIRRIVERSTGIPSGNIMVCCTHTHSGPATGGFFSLGAAHPPYLQTLPQRIAAAGINAYRRLEEARVFHAEVPCTDIAYNRVCNRRPEHEVAAGRGWSQGLEGPIDTSAHVLTFRSSGKAGQSTGGILGFISYFSVHPVVCCGDTRAIHGDFVGLATNKVQADFEQGGTGIFIPGACGDINSGFCHNDEKTSQADLEMFSDRYAAVIREGIDQGTALEGRCTASRRKVIKIPQQPIGIDKLEREIKALEAALDSEEMERNLPKKGVLTAELAGNLLILQKLRQGGGETLDVEIMAARFGGVTLVSAPFEIFHGIKSQVQSNLAPTLALVVGYTNGYAGYAPVSSEYDKPYSYAAHVVPLLLGEPPLTPNLEAILVKEMSELASCL